VSPRPLFAWSSFGTSACCRAALHARFVQHCRLTRAAAGAVNTDSDNTIECVISEDKRCAQFDCTKPFKLFDDRETLSLMRDVGQCDEEALAKMLPGKFVRVGEWAHP
jgi:hypothetical protein